MSAAFRERYIAGKVAGRGAPLIVVIPPTALEAERLLAFELEHETWPTRQKAGAIRRELGISQTAYVQQLNRLIDSIEGPDEELPKIIVRLRQRRRELRARREIQHAALRDRIRP
jgi:hypothetical protein